MSSSRMLRSKRARPADTNPKLDENVTDTASEEDVSDVSTSMPSSQPAQQTGMPITRVCSINGKTAIVVQKCATESGAPQQNGGLVDGCVGNNDFPGYLSAQIVSQVEPQVTSFDLTGSSQDRSKLNSVDLNAGLGLNLFSELDTLFALPERGLSEILDGLDELGNDTMPEAHWFSQPRGSAQYDAQQQQQQLGNSYCVYQRLDDGFAQYLEGESSMGEFMTGTSLPELMHGAVASAKMMQPESTQSSTYSVTDFPGDYEFELSFPEITGKEWVFNQRQRKLYVKDTVDFDFVFATAKKAAPNMSIRISAFHHDQGNFGKHVEACLAHANLGATYLTSNDRGVQYEGSGALVFPFQPKSSHGAYRKAVHLKLACKNSDFKPKSIIKAHCELLDGSGKLIGKQSIELRGCACPVRDAAESEKRSSGTATKKAKRKRGEGSPSSPPVPDRPASSNDGLQPYAREDCTQICDMKTSKRTGMWDRGYMDKDGCYVYSMHLRMEASPQVKNVLVVIHDTAKCVPCEPAPSGFKAQMIQTHPDKTNRRPMEDIQRWIDEVVKCTTVNAVVFASSGYNTLAKIFQMTSTQIDAVLSDFIPAIRMKFQQAVHAQTPPLPPMREDSMPSIFASQQ